MVVLSLALSLLASASATSALAAPQVKPQTIPLVRRGRAEKTSAWLEEEREILRTKYGSPDALSKRATGTNQLVNQNADSSYYGTIAIGTPAVSYNVILDTGSADLWVADSDCITGCSDVPTFNAYQSTTFQNSSRTFSIQYGSGSARGSIGQDVVQMAGFSVQNQVFAICDTVSRGLLVNPVSGLMGLAFSSIASSRATPFWQTLATTGAWDSPLMAFHLTRYLDDNNARTLEPGGSFTMGAVDSSLYTGSIEFLSLPNNIQTYWILPLTTMTVQGNAISLPSGSSSYAAIDTGTTLVGGPAAQIAAIYAQIPGSQQGTGSEAGYYFYPCGTNINITMSFGGRSWPINSADFLLQSTGGRCIGAFFELATGGSAPAWIVGDTFLKNVYSVFRFNPPSIGFATLSDTATAQNGANGALPTPTIGSVAAVTATGSPRGNAASSVRQSLTSVAAFGVIGILALMVL